MAEATACYGRASRALYAAGDAETGAAAAQAATYTRRAEAAIGGERSQRQQAAAVQEERNARSSPDVAKRQRHCEAREKAGFLDAGSCWGQVVGYAQQQFAATRDPAYGEIAEAARARAAAFAPIAQRIAVETAPLKLRLDHPDDLALFGAMSNFPNKRTPAQERRARAIVAEARNGQ